MARCTHGRTPTDTNAQFLHDHNVREEYEYMEDHELPALVLGIPIHPDHPEEYKPVDGNGLAWRKIVHQTAGYGCRQHYIYGTVLPVKPEIREGVKALAECYLDSQLYQSVTLATAVEYQKMLRDLFGHTVGCNVSHWELEEALYPIDCTPEALAALSTATLPADLDTLFEWESDLEQLFGIVGRWHLYVLGENSD